MWLYVGIFTISDEDLIKWGWPEDVWFHVDKVSSAHVYLRLNPVSGGPCTQLGLNLFSFTRIKKFTDVPLVATVELVK